MTIFEEELKRYAYEISEQINVFLKDFGEQSQHERLREFILYMKVKIQILHT